MAREYPDRPVVGVGGVVIVDGRTLLIKRGSEPLLGQWSIPGGTLELGESLQEGVARELLEETGLEVRVLDMIEVFDRIFLEPQDPDRGKKLRPRYHYVIVDELEKFHMTQTAMRVLRRAFAMDRERRKPR
jgi:ADP-ribose pyrophosphatase YjhB (NUDIX family)